jgi:hypothetical protein
MLGIFGGHLLRLADSPNWDLLRIVVQNLQNLIGDHPDVVALDLFLDENRSVSQPHPTLAQPPLLRRSWEQIVRASAQRPDLIEPGSFPARIADRLWSSGVWLTWQTPSDNEAETAPQPKGARSFDAAIFEISGAAQDRTTLAKAVEEAELTDLEESLLRYVHRLAQIQNWPTNRDALTESELTFSPSEGGSAMLTADLVQAMGLPPTVLDQVVTTLVTKLENRPQATVTTRWSVQLAGDRAVIGSSAGGSIITGSGNVVTKRGRQAEPPADLAAQLRRVEAAIGAQEGLRGTLPDQEIEAILAPLLRKQAELQAQLRSGEVLTEDSFQSGGEGAVIGSAAAGDIITGDQNRLEEDEDDDGGDESAREKGR